MYNRQARHPGLFCKGSFIANRYARVRAKKQGDKYNEDAFWWEKRQRKSQAQCNNPYNDMPISMAAANLSLDKLD